MCELLKFGYYIFGVCYIFGCFKNEDWFGVDVILFWNLFYLIMNGVYLKGNFLGYREGLRGIIKLIG